MIRDAASAFSVPPPPSRAVGLSRPLKAMTEALSRGERVVITGSSEHVGLGRRTLAVCFCGLADEALGEEAIWLPGRAFDPRLVVSRLAIALGQHPHIPQSRNLNASVERLLDGRRPVVVLEDAQPTVVSLFPTTLPLICIVRSPAVARAISGRVVEVAPWSEQQWQKSAESLTEDLPSLDVPLTLEVGRLLAHHPLSISLALGLVRAGAVEGDGLVARLKQRLHRLAAFPLDRRGVAAIFSVLLDCVSSEDQARIGALGALPATGFSRGAAADALGLASRVATSTLELCVDLAVVQRQGGGRFRLHPLLGDLARGIGGAESARRRVGRHYANFVSRADPEGGGLDIEAEGIFQTLEWATSDGHLELGVELARGLIPWVDARGFTQGITTWYRLAAEAAEDLGDYLSQGAVRSALGRSYGREEGGRGATLAVESHLVAVACLEDEPQKQAEALLELGEAQADCGQLPAAIASIERARALFARDDVSQTALEAGHVEQRLGELQAEAGRDDAARDHLMAALGLYVGGGAESERVDAVQRVLEAVNGRLFIDDAFAVEESVAAPSAMPEAAPSESREPRRHREPAGGGIPAPPPPDVLDNALASQRYAEHLRAVEDALAGGRVREVASEQAALGRLLGSRGDFTGALQHYQLALAHHRGCGDRLGEASTLEDMGSLSTMAGELDQAMCALLKALELREEAGSLDGKAHSLLQLSQVYFARGDVVDGLAHLKLSEACFERARDFEGVAAVRLARSAGLVEQASFAEGQAWAQRGLELAEELEVRPLIAEAEHILGEIAVSHGNFDEGASRLRRSVYLRQVEADVQGIAASLHSIAELHRRRGDDIAAWSYNDRLFEISGRLGLWRIQARCCEALGDLARDRGNWRDAGAKYGLSRRLYEKVGSPSGVAELNLKLGDLALDGHDAHRALDHYSTARMVAGGAGLQKGQALALYKEGIARAMSNDCDGARSALRQGLSLDESRDDQRGVVSSLVLLGQLDVAQGRLEQARGHWRRALALLDDIDGTAAQTLRLWLGRLPEPVT